MKGIRITDSDHTELVRRKDQTGVSIIFQVSKLIAESKKDYANETEETPILSTVPK